MPASRREFLATAACAASVRGAGRASTRSNLDGAAIAQRHSIVRDGATPDFFEGMLLGNGDIGVCVTVRPDALGLHIGKSDSWDIRVSEEHASQVLTFAELLKLWDRASEEAKRLGKPEMLFMEEEIPFFREYSRKVTASYGKTWPRPWPCGIVWLHWDPTRFRILRQTLDPSNGHYRLDLVDEEDKPVSIFLLVNTTAGHVCMWGDAPAEFRSVAYYPNLDSSARLPNPSVNCDASTDSAQFSAYQRFPAIPPTPEQPAPPPSDKDRSFALHSVLQGRWRVAGLANSSDHAEVLPESAGPQPLRLDIALFTPRDHPENVEFAASEANRLSRVPFAELKRLSDPYWQDLWSRSAVQFEDKELERWWYHNQYWLACCLRSGKVAPGLFGNWTSGKIGTAWHGDYHMNYNTQQVFWGVFSSNHAEQHFPYIELVENLLPMSRRYAEEKFGMPGAYFPHSAYPVPSQAVPYPAPPWGYELCETPWTVQSLWWHYLYTQDDQVLQRIFPLIRAAAQFVTAYVKAGDDGRYHVKPSVSPENWGCTVDYRLNQDCIVDLALIDFLLDAAIKGSEILKSDERESATWAKIRARLAHYPTAVGPNGVVWIDVPNAPVRWIYNVPVTLAPVFPGERVGLHSASEELELARRTAKSIRLEGGNDIVFQPLVRARLGMLDLDWFKREVRYCQLPNGVVNDRVRQTGGRYRDATDFDFMMRMGVWTENLSLPAVLNECMLQSYSGTLRIFPNTTNLAPARFRHLRAAGAFLVSAEWDGRSVSNIEILSERGRTVRIADPWNGMGVQVLRAGDRGQVRVQQSGENVFEFETEAGKEYLVGRA